MKILRIVGISVIVILTVYFIVIIELPSEVYVERSVSVDASPSRVYNYLEDLRNFQEWAYWAEIDPNTIYTYTGPSKGVGSTLDWHSEHRGMGFGSWWIISATPHSQIICKIQLREFAKPAIVEFNLSEEAGLTKISWTFETDFHGYWKFFVPMMDDELGPAYEKGLAKIKNNLEDPLN